MNKLMHYIFVIGAIASYLVGIVFLVNDDISLPRIIQFILLAYFTLAMTLGALESYD